MADAQANIGIGVDTSQALAAIRQLQREISAFHTSMAKGGALANAESMRLSQNLVNTINAGGKFSAGMTRISAPAPRASPTPLRKTSSLWASTSDMRGVLLKLWKDVFQRIQHN
jgi:hypothetical protein